MWAKIKAAFLYAVGLILTGIAVAVGLQQGLEEEGVSCDEWQTGIELFQDTQKNETMFMAVQQGIEQPKAYADRVLGDCNAQQKTCSIGPSTCPNSFTYGFSFGSLVSVGETGYRLVEIKAPLYILRGWMKWAEGTEGVEWLGSFGQLKDSCTDKFTNPQCLALFDADDCCWLLDDGTICRHGIKSVVIDEEGQDVITTCPYAHVVAKLPCVVDRGAGSEEIDVLKQFEIVEDELVVVLD